MTSFGKRLAGILLAGSLALGGLVGCAGGGAPEAKNTEELLALFEKTSKDNNHADMTMDMNIDLLGQSIAMPISGSFDTAEGKTHGTMTMDLSALGSEKIDIETYAEKDGDAYIQYMSMDGATWIKQESTSGSFTGELTNVDVLGQGEFTKTDSGYQIAVTGDKIMGAIAAATGGSTDSLLGSNPSVTDALKGTDAIFAFDKEGQITGVKMNMNMSGGETDSTMSAAITLNLDVTFSNQGKVDVATVTVPEEVKSGATDLTSMTASAIESFGEELEEATEAIDSAEATSAAAEATSADGTSAAETTSAAEATSAAETTSAAEATSAAA